VDSADLHLTLKDKLIHNAHDVQHKVEEVAHKVKDEVEEVAHKVEYCFCWLLHL